MDTMQSEEDGHYANFFFKLNFVCITGTHGEKNNQLFRKYTTLPKFGKFDFPYSSVVNSYQKCPAT